jgi:hypothetical protein
MTHLAIQFQTTCVQETCALCGQAARTGEGPCLVLADRPEPVCRACGKEHAPSLVSLLDLATTARRVGRIGRHGMSLPLSALLDLARAAENFLDASGRPLRRAA